MNKPRSSDRAADEKDRPQDPYEKAPGRPSPRRPRRLRIRIDRQEYAVPFGQLRNGTLTGLQIRRFPDPDIGPERDLYEVAPGGSDRKIGNDDRVRIRDGMRFFSAPAFINPGSAAGALAGVCRASG